MNKIICILCFKDIEEKIGNYFIPSKCFKINGFNGHKICYTCWWNKFALENNSHKCVGCIKNIALYHKKNKKILNNQEIIDLT